MDEGCIILADGESKGYGFARKVYEYICKKPERALVIGLANIGRTTFEDKEYKLRIMDNIRRKKVFYIHDGNKEPATWFCDLSFALDAIKFASPSEINVVLPYMRFMRQDRKDESRVSVNIRAVAEIISSYADRGMTIDLHAPQIQGYFRIPFDNLQSFPTLTEHLKRNYREVLENLVIISPDVGGAKRVESLQKRLNKDRLNVEMAICYKRRSEKNKVDGITIMGDVKGKNCLILDDIVDTGRTLAAASNELREQGAKNLYVYGTHGLFTKGFDVLEKFDKVMVSDSLFNSERDKLEIISMVELLGEAIFRTIEG